MLLEPWCAQHAIALALPSKGARHTAIAAQALAEGLLANPRSKLMFLSDNGSVFKGAFDQTPQCLGLTHFCAYPKSPKTNAHAERFNRTLQKSFVDDHGDLLYTDLTLFNQTLADGLVFHNTHRPHHRLGQQPPQTPLLQHHPECQRYWTHTTC